MDEDVKRHQFEEPPERVGTVRHDPVRAVADYAVSKGMRRERVNNLVGLPAGTPRATGILPAAVGPELMKQILESGIGAAPAIEIAERAPFSFFGGLERAILLAPNGQEALRTMIENFNIFHDRLIPEYEESKSYTKFSFRFDGDELDNGGCNEVVLSVLLRIMRSVFGQNGQPREVFFRNENNGILRKYEDFYASPLNFRSHDQSFGLVFETSNLQSRQPGYDRAVFKLAKQRLAHASHLRRRKSPMLDYLELINAANVSASQGTFHVRAVAARAGLGERKAQRIAQKHGTTVRKLIDQARLKLLRDQIIRRPDTCAEDLSQLLGFSDGRAFRRAVKSWTGKPISEFRRTA
ncbi:MAG: helix-turn-helix domain-containing protein [Pseudomonadota bacterium]